MTFLQAEYRSRDAAVAAVEALAGAGFPKADLELYSRRPVEADPPVLPRKSRMSLVAVLAAVACGAGATAFVFWTQLAFPLATGGMPLTSGWATAVITFEATMAGAIAGIFLMLIVEGGLLRSPRSAPAPRLPDEGIVLQVACRPDRSGAARRVLADSGGAAVGETEAPR